MIFIDKVFKLGTCFTTQAFLKASTTLTQCNNQFGEHDLPSTNENDPCLLLLLLLFGGLPSGESPFPWCRPNEHGMHRCHGPFSDYPWWLALLLL